MKAQLSPLQWIATRHYDRMSSIICSRQDQVPKINREVRFLEVVLAPVWQRDPVCVKRLAELAAMKWDKREPMEVWQYERDLDRLMAISVAVGFNFLQRARADEDASAEDFLAGEGLDGVEVL